MMQTPIGRPETTEYAPYYEKYVALINEDDVVTAFEKQGREMLELLRGIGDDKADYRYAPGKWTVKEVVGHITDAERAMAYRAFYFGRNNQGAIPGFDQDVTSEHAKYGRLSLNEILDEYDCVRRATLHLLRHFDQDAWMRRGVANDSDVSVRALAYLTLGHERHHLGILKSRYLL